MSGQLPKTQDSPTTTLSSKADATQEAFNAFAGVDGGNIPIDQKLVDRDRTRINGPLSVGAVRRGSVAVAHMLENSINPGSVRSAGIYQDRQLRENEAGRLLPH